MTNKGEHGLYKVVKEGRGGIVARIVADSVSEFGNRITTFELEYHRFIHAEMLTHRTFSRNAMSSRAVPVKTLIEQVRNNPATPIHWGKNQAGMQAKEEVQGKIIANIGGIYFDTTPKDLWKEVSEVAAKYAEEMSNAGLHKQVVNRLLEPFQMMKVVLTATEFDNFFWLRLDPDAQPEIQELAKCMYEAMQESEPEVLKAGEWHTPYVGHADAPHDNSEIAYCVYESGVEKYITVEEAKAISASCCAQVSYRRLDNTYEKAIGVYERLGVGGNKIHASPFESVATPMTCTNISNLPEGTVWEEGVTHVDADGDFWSGNLKGFVQLRQQLKGSVCKDYAKRKLETD